MKTEFQMLTTDEVADLYGVTPSRVRQFLAEKRIPGAYLRGRQWFIPRGFRVTPVRQGRPPKPTKR